ncbi:MAG: CopG family transcriptional regulator [Methylococcales bacterium]|nr:CopG family transcriptional regulator [Methylococcales bacterium]
MSKHFEIHIPDQLWQQAQSMVTQGWVNNMDSLIVESIRRYIESHQPTSREDFIREDIDWGLHGKD